MQTLPIKLSALAVSLGLAACGDTLAEQAVLGGAAGAGVAAVAGGAVLTGAAVGAAGNVAICQFGEINCR
ncbi:MAG: hypothetical protein AAF965_11535 [Pseudomonadota bacterium]